MRCLMLCLALLATALPASAQLIFMPGLGLAGDVNLPVTSMKSARTRTTLIQKYDFSCGSAAVATLLTHHYNFPVTEATVFQEMFADGDQQKIHKEGFSLLDMKRYLELHGFEADGFEQPLDKLREAGVPAIVLINEGGYHHFVVVKGVEDDRVLIGDPAQGTRVMPRYLFETKWKNGLLFVIHNHMETAKFNVASEWRVTPRSPLSSGISRTNMSDITMPRMGPGEF